MGKGVVECGFSCGVNLFLFLFFFFFLLPMEVKGKGLGWEQQCDLFTGTWVVDESYPLYRPATCPFIEREFRCEANGRPDLIYTHYRWQPLTCNLLRFNGRDFLEKMRGKSIMFVGDSLSRNQWQSLTCLLHSAVPNSNYTLARVGDVSIFTFTEYKVKVMLDRNVYLVDVVRENMGRVLKLDSIEGSKLWKGVDNMLIFNTWHWWSRRGPTQPLTSSMAKRGAFLSKVLKQGNWIPPIILIYLFDVEHFHPLNWQFPSVYNHEFKGSSKSSA